jgi:arsenate reductase (glutaredoxin)
MDEATRAAVADNASAKALLLQHASAIKRPVVEWADGQITVGFDASAWQHRV